MVVLIKEKLIYKKYEDQKQLKALNSNNKEKILKQRRIVTRKECKQIK